ncbi:hypothetical protein GCM10007897_28830 [Sphingobium jiangsuense]|uniref:Tape measure domain-containing protein n=1 Tax=Sphingobium jiangsuense TaxID=870476 RepID=A0A7W6FNC6_9SPHN|nr:tape measure protein [Sphingobium jiangsuense]MBB3924600.1 tape measure domain-containing protein [Sphingobium jiangsuense]GLT01489.1 hypothetical protein GCM10007897_28830 [Sphingobium jiangsuense]
MATETEQLVVSLEARIRDFERNFQRANRAANDNFGKIENRARVSARRMEKSMADAATGMGNRLKGLAGSLAAAFSARELISLTDSYTRFQNSLRVAGVEGANLKLVQDQLFASAQRYGVELETLGQLYGRASQAAVALGASQSDLLKFTNNISAAVKVQGGSVQQASGALLQLSQALQSGTVRAEEFNSINEGLFPVLQAVAAGNERFGGSVAKLRAEVMAGTVSSREFFEAFQAGAPMLEERAAKSVLTTSAAFQTLRNALVQYFGEADQSNGATAALAEAIKMLADNLDIVIPAIATLSGALGIGFVVNAARAAVAARGVGAALLGAFGGPVGIAITGITVALVGLASETAKTRAALDGVEAITSDAARALNDAKGKADSAATGVRGVGSEAAASETKVRSFAGAVGEAAQELYNLARARQAALISDLEAKRQEASVQYSELWGQTRRGLDARVRGDGSIRHQIFSLDGWKADLTRLGRSIGMLEDPEAELQEGMNDLKGAMADYDAAIAEASRNLERFATNPRTPAPAGTKPTGRTRTGKTDAERAAEAEKRLQERIQQATDDLRLQLRLSDLRAEGLDVQADKEQAIANIRQQFPELVNTENAALREQLALMEGLAIAAVDRAEAQRQAQEQKEREETYSGIIGDGQNFIRDQGNEMQAMGMDPQAASAFLHEQDMLNQAQQQGIELTAGQRAEIAQLAQGMAAAEAATTAFAQAQRNAAELSRFFGDSAVDALHGVITGTKNAKQSILDMTSALIKMALQSMLLGSGPMAGLFGGPAGGLGGVIGGLLGFAEGGHIRGPGTSTSDSIPIMASNGEYVINAKATRKHLPLLEAINSGKAPAFATGGRIGASLSNTYAPSVNVNVAGGQDARVARQIADAVGQALDSRRPDTFRRSEAQQLAKAQTAISRAGTRNN